MRKKLIKLIEHIVVPYFAAEIADHLIENDAVPVVRCKDCKRYSDFDATNCKRLSFHFCNMFDNITKENDFCSYGERKEK